MIIFTSIPEDIRPIEIEAFMSCIGKALALTHVLGEAAVEPDKTLTFIFETSSDLPVAQSIKATVCLAQERVEIIADWYVEQKSAEAIA